MKKVLSFLLLIVIAGCGKSGVEPNGAGTTPTPDPNTPVTKTCTTYPNETEFLNASRLILNKVAGTSYGIIKFVNDNSKDYQDWTLANAANHLCTIIYGDKISGFRTSTLNGFAVLEFKEYPSSDDLKKWRSYRIFPPSTQEPWVGLVVADYDEALVNGVAQPPKVYVSGTFVLVK